MKPLNVTRINRNFPLPAGFLPGSVGERRPRIPHELHHVPDLRTLPAVPQESLGPRAETTVQQDPLSWRPEPPTSQTPRHFTDRTSPLWARTEPAVSLRSVVGFIHLQQLLQRRWRWWRRRWRWWVRVIPESELIFKLVDNTAQHKLPLV